MRTFIATAAVLAAALGAPAQAAVPEVLSFQGRLTGTDGYPITDPALKITFRIYDDATSTDGANLKWEDTRTVNVADGAFSVLLGDTATGGAALGLPFDTQYWLALLVGLDTDEMALRFKFAAAPYALKAKDADTVDGVHAADLMHASTDNWVDEAGDTMTGALNLPVNGLAVGTSQLVISGGNVGVGTGAPAYKLDVAGSFRADGLRVEPNSFGPNVTGGYSGNAVTLGVVGGTVSGGGTSEFYFSERPNRVTDDYGVVGGGAGNQAGDGLGTTTDSWFSTVSGGFRNIAGSEAATVGGGESNRANAMWSTVGGGMLNSASGAGASVGGGGDNLASGVSATVPGGAACAAAGDFSFAAGRRAKANSNGSFAWADSTNADFIVNADNRFAARATGGVYFYTSTALDAGSYLAPGSSSWSFVSDRRRKENFRNEDGEAALSKIAGMPIRSWNWKSQCPSIRHIGPIAQDFHKAFGLGENDVTISTVDAVGINMLAVQALEKRTSELGKENAALKAEIAELRQLLTTPAGKR